MELFADLRLIELAAHLVNRSQTAIRMGFRHSRIATGPAGIGAQRSELRFM
jgi:hypothetical protein